MNPLPANPTTQTATVADVRSSRRSATVLAVLWFSLLSASASLVTFNRTNSVGAPDTNAFKITAVSTIYANGTFTTIGLPQRVTPAADGGSTNYLRANNYYATNYPGSPSFSLLFSVPDNSSNVINAGDWQISGANYFVTRVINTNIPPAGMVTNNQTGVTLAGTFSGAFIGTGNLTDLTMSGTLNSTGRGNFDSVFVQATAPNGYAGFNTGGFFYADFGGILGGVFISTNGLQLLNTSTRTWYGAFNGDGSGVTNTPLSATSLATITNIANNVTNGLISGQTASNSFASWSAVTTNDPVAVSFFASNNITDLEAQRRINRAIAEAKAGGWWAIPNDARLFQTEYNPTNNLSLRLKTWTATSPLYSQWGALFKGTNFHTGPLPTVISNQFHTEVFVFRPTVDYMNLACKLGTDNDMYWASFEFIGGVQNSNSSAGVYTSRINYGGIGTWEHIGAATNWGFDVSQSAGTFTTNCFNPADWNQYTCRQPDSWKIVVHSTSNNLHQVWVNSVTAAAGQVTNMWRSLINCTEGLNQFNLGNSSNAQYYAFGASAGLGQNIPTAQLGGNPRGLEMYMAMSIATNCTQALAESITRFCLLLQPQQEVWIASGSSKVNQANGVGLNYYGSFYYPWTNSFCWFWNQDRPQDLNVNFASPGSYAQKGLTFPVGINGTTNFNFAFISNCVAAGKTVRVVNDAFNDASNPTAATGKLFWRDLMTRMWQAGAAEIIAFQSDPPSQDKTATTNEWAMRAFMLTNGVVPISYFVDALSVSSTNNVAFWSPQGGVHLDNPTNGAINFLIQEARNCRNKANEWFNPTNPVERWRAGGNVMPAGDNANLYMLTNNGATFNWGIK